ncbi:MAG: polyphosphate polymerase domain-containing protein [bacterium]|nr:polyphosphate polymerase domain-containing protein [bacterium]
MATAQTVFKRYEKKYLLNQTQYERMLTFLNDYMKQDEYGLHTIRNIYYDTDEYDLIRTSLGKPLYKEKFRVRSYSQVSEMDTVFLELKKKYDGVVYKRREALTLAEADAYLKYGYQPLKNGQIMHEIDWFLNINDIMPKVFIAYDRIALFSEEDPNLRVTFDHNIRFRDYDLSLSSPAYGKKLLEHDRYLMELKIGNAMPLWLSQYLARENIFQTSYSKYGTCYTNYLFYKKLAVINRPDYDYSLQKGGIYCA